MIFVDTSFWAALQNRGDPLHTRSLELLRLHRSETLVTTNQVRAETWSLLRAKAGHVAAVRFIEMLGASERIQLVFVTEEHEAEAVSWLRRHDELPYSFVDATSFIVMTHRRIRDALTFDAMFGAAGFNVLPSPRTVER